MTRLDFDYVSETNRARCAKWHPGFPDENTWSLADWGNAMGECMGELGTGLALKSAATKRLCDLHDEYEDDDEPVG